jgi:hypothetical protein
MAAPERFDGCEVVKKLSTGPITDLYHAIQEPLGRPALEHSAVVTLRGVARA